MTLKDSINSDFVHAMKAKDDLKVSVLRLLKTAIMKFEVAGKKKKEATDPEILEIIGKEVKQRKDSIEAYQQGSRPDLAEKEEIEMKILETYMPAQMSAEELKEVISRVISQTSANSKADFGKVMRALMPQVKGRASGDMVSKLVGSILK